MEPGDFLKAAERYISFHKHFYCSINLLKDYHRDEAEKDGYDRAIYSDVFTGMRLLVFLNGPFYYRRTLGNFPSIVRGNLFVEVCCYFRPQQHKLLVSGYRFSASFEEVSIR